MMRLKNLSLILALLLLSTPASSQDISWDKRFEAAMSKEMPSQKVDALLELSRSESDFQNRIVAGYNAMTIAYESQRYETAAEIGEKILELTDEHAKGNLKQRDAIASYLISTYFRDDKAGEARRVIDENLRMNDAALDDLWATVDKSIIHRFSGMACPNQIGDLYRENTRVYHPMGIDVGCDYKAYNGEDNTVSLYFSNYGFVDTTDEKAHNDAMEAVKVNWGTADLIIDNKVSDFESDANTSVRESIFRLGSVQKGYRYTGTWTSIIDEWLLKSRITWDGTLGENFGRLHARALFEATPDNIPEHLKFCKAPTVNQKATRLDVTDTTSLSALLFNLPTDADASAPPLRPHVACMGESSNEGNAIVEWYKDSGRVYSIVGSSVENDVYVSSSPNLSLLDKSSTPKYILKSISKRDETAETTTSILAIYSGKPSSIQILNDYANIRNGKIESMGSIVRDSNGDTTINVNTGKVK